MRLGDIQKLDHFLMNTYSSLLNDIKVIFVQRFISEKHKELKVTIKTFLFFFQCNLKEAHKRINIDIYINKLIVKKLPIRSC